MSGEFFPNFSNGNYTKVSEFSPTYKLTAIQIIFKVVNAQKLDLRQK